jgi:hypothetical protein
MNRKARDRRVAEEVVNELYDALGPVLLHQIGCGVVTSEALPEEARDKVGDVFSRVFDRHKIVTKFAGANVLACIPRILAKAELNRQLDAAMRQPLIRTKK